MPCHEFESSLCYTAVPGQAVLHRQDLSGVGGGVRSGEGKGACFVIMFQVAQLSEVLISV